MIRISRAGPPASKRGFRAHETAERRAKSACLRFLTLIQVGYSRRALRVDRVKPPLLGAKRRFPNGCGGLAFCAWEEKS